MSGCPEAAMRWEVLRSEIIYRCRIFSVRHDQSRSLRSGQTSDFYVLECSDWVNVVPLTRDQQVVMVRQFRHGIRDFTLEVPAGLMDAADRSPADAAQRELREETGYAGEDLVPLGVVHPNPAIMNNRCHVFMARDVELVGAPQWDGTEELVVETVRLDRVPELILNGTVGNALTLVAFHLLELQGHGRLAALSG
jgi:8-oxo-dGTP pyrophosphatase MutT (NUDIX family)